MPDHNILKLARYLENSTNNMIPTHVTFDSADKKIRVFEPTVAYACEFQQVGYGHRRRLRGAAGALASQ